MWAAEKGRPCEGQLSRVAMAEQEERVELEKAAQKVSGFVWAAGSDLYRSRSSDLYGRCAVICVYGRPAVICMGATPHLHKQRHSLLILRTQTPQRILRPVILRPPSHLYGRRRPRSHLYGRRRLRSHLYGRLAVICVGGWQ